MLAMFNTIRLGSVFFAMGIEKTWESTISCKRIEVSISFFVRTWNNFYETLDLLFYEILMNENSREDVSFVG